MKIYERDFEMFLKGMVYQSFQKRAPKNQIGVQRTPKGVVLVIPGLDSYLNVSRADVDAFAGALEDILAQLRAGEIPCKKDTTD